MKIRADVQNVPIEKNVQSAGVSLEEQIFYINDDDETEEQCWARKEAIRKNPAMEEPAALIQTLSTQLVKEQPEIQVRLRRTNQIIIEQSGMGPWTRRRYASRPIAESSLKWRI